MSFTIPRFLFGVVFMNIRLAIASIAGIVTVSLPAAAFDQDVALGSSRYTIGISGFVPVICRATVSETSVAPTAGTVQLGSLKEFCNSPRGYLVHADYSASLSSAKLVVDGVAKPLSDDGTVVVSSSDHAAITDRTVALEVPEGVQGGTISFRIDPL